MSDQLEADSETASETNERGCYCGLWKTDPSILEKQGIPEGYCGLCRICGKPGHTRHHPGAVPFTGAWCDKHYKRTAWTHPLACPGILFWLAGVGAVALLVFGL